MAPGPQGFPPSLPGGPASPVVIRGLFAPVEETQMPGVDLDKGARVTMAGGTQA